MEIFELQTKKIKNKEGKVKGSIYHLLQLGIESRTRLGEAVIKVPKFYGVRLEMTSSIKNQRLLYSFLTVGLGAEDYSNHPQTRRPQYCSIITYSFLGERYYKGGQVSFFLIVITRTSQKIRGKEREREIESGGVVKLTQEITFFSRRRRRRLCLLAVEVIADLSDFHRLQISCFNRIDLWLFFEYCCLIGVALRRELNLTYPACFSLVLVFWI